MAFARVTACRSTRLKRVSELTLVSDLGHHDGRGMQVHFIEMN